MTDVLTERPTEQGNFARGSDYAKLTERIRAAGLLKRRTGHFATRFGITMAVLGGLVALLVVIGDSWLQLLVAAGFGIVFTQMAFLAHDIGHRQVFRTKRAAQLAGLALGNVGIGLSYGWWMGKHTRHHANPNHVDDDPDVGVGVIAWSADQANEKGGASRWLAAWQAFLFFPLLLLEGLQLHVQSFRALRQPEVKWKLLEGTLLSARVVGCLAILLVTMSPVKALVFVAIAEAAFGLYMGSSFAPNHKGMPMVEGRIDFLRKQVLTSRNVRGGWFVDHLLGGLNYQIEHHLFPTMPMPNLRRAKIVVQAFCEEHRISYAEVGLLRSYQEVLRYLHEVGASLRPAGASA